LQKIPGSYLDRITKNEVKNLKDKDGNIFLDQCGTTFEYILQYLRDGDIIFPRYLNLKLRVKKAISKLKKVKIIDEKKLIVLKLS